MHAAAVAMVVAVSAAAFAVAVSAAAFAEAVSAAAFAEAVSAAAFAAGTAATDMDMGMDTEDARTDVRAGSQGHTGVSFTSAIEGMLNSLPFRFSTTSTPLPEIGARAEVGNTEAASPGSIITEEGEWS